MKSNSFRAGQIFIWIPSTKAVFHYSGKRIQTAKRSSKCITERSSATGIDFVHKEQSSNFQWRSWSLLCSKSAWSEYPRKSCKFGMVLHHSVLRKVRRWKPTSRETRWPSAQNNNKPAEVLHLKRESEKKKSTFNVNPASAPDFLHILCFTAVNSFSVLAVTIEMIWFFSWDWNTFLSSQINMYQKHRVFEFLI